MAANDSLDADRVITATHRYIGADDDRIARLEALALTTRPSEQKVVVGYRP